MQKKEDHLRQKEFIGKTSYLFNSNIPIVHKTLKNAITSKNNL